MKKKNKEIYDKVEVSYYDPDKKKVVKEIITKEELDKRNQVTTEEKESKNKDNKKDNKKSQKKTNKKPAKKVKSKKK